MVLFHNINLGQRVEVNMEWGVIKGVVKYKGSIATKAGDWVGVELEEPFGNCDGMIFGRRYFLCKDGYGLYVRASRLRFIPIIRCLYNKYHRVSRNSYVEEPLFGSNPDIFLWMKAGSTDSSALVSGRKGYNHCQPLVANRIMMWSAFDVYLLVKLMGLFIKYIIWTISENNFIHYSLKNLHNSLTVNPFIITWFLLQAHEGNIHISAKYHERVKQSFDDTDFLQKSRNFPLRHSISATMPAATMKRPRSVTLTYTTQPIHSEYELERDFFTPSPSIPKIHMPYTALRNQVKRGWENAHYVREMSMPTGRDSMVFTQWNDISI